MKHKEEIKIMKKWFILILSVVLAFCSAACGADHADSNRSNTGSAAETEDYADTKAELPDRVIGNTVLTATADGGNSQTIYLWEEALDLARAVRFVRKNAEVYGIDENDIAVMGFSAGGRRNNLFFLWQAQREQ